jgi:SAM-dependent methyltransferase
MSHLHSLAAISRALFPEKDAGTKPDDYYRVYEPHFAPIRNKSLNIVELGVLEGKSTKIFSRYFQHSRILAIDLTMRPIDFSDYANVHYTQCDQKDRLALAQLCNTTFPLGIDLVIDDAAHIGLYSLEAFLCLFPLLRPGGIYVIEDWGTGYWNDWPDGRSFQAHTCSDRKRGLYTRISSHDYGMVGMIKLLIDYVAGSDVRPTQGSPKTRSALIDTMEIHFGTVLLRKADTPPGKSGFFPVRMRSKWPPAMLHRPAGE